MRAVTGILALVFSTGCMGLANGMSTEELIFEKSPYVEAAKAAEQGDVATLKKLISQGIDLNHEGKETRGDWGADTMTLLTWAVLNDSFKGTEELLKAGADPNKSTGRGMTSLMLASASKNEKLFELLLIQYKADPNKVFIGQRETALTIALQERRNLGERRFDRAETLLKRGANIDVNMDRGETALIRFGIQEDWRAVYWLLEHGANYEARNKIGATVMCFLRDSYKVNNLTHSEAYTYRDKVRNRLLARGVERSRVDPALHPSTRCDD